MAYDPKKTRAKQKDVEAVIDEIVDEEKLKEAKKSVKKPIAKENDAEIIDIKDLQEQKVLDDISKEADAPLYMQPQVWVTLAASAIVTLFIIRRRRK